jgi:hypothetical protein
MRVLRPLALLALLLTALLAGCAGAPGETMSARDGLGDAEDAAGKWAEGEDLHLIGIAAVEPFKRINWTYDGDGDEESGEVVTHLDGSPGDGKAPAWAYGFLAGGRCIGVVLAAGLGVLAEGYESCDGSDTVGDWEVDSDEAVDLLRERPEWTDLGPSASFFWALEADEGQATWSVFGENQDGQALMAVVDAESGDILEIESGEGGGDDFGFFDAGSGPGASPGGSGSDEDQDSAMTLTPGQSLTAEVELGGVGALVLDLSARATLQGMSLVVEGPNGVVDEDSVGGVVGNEYQEQRAYADLPPGLYTVTLTAEGATVFPSVLAMAYW